LNQWIADIAFQSIAQRFYLGQVWRPLFVWKNHLESLPYIFIRNEAFTLLLLDTEIIFT
jgi:hypothetical protein